MTNLLCVSSPQVAVCAMMCNFTKPTKDKPALLDHSEVSIYYNVTYFWFSEESE